MEEKVTEAGFFALLWGWILVFLLYLAVGFGLGLGLWCATRLMGSESEAPNKLFDWLGKQASKLTSKGKKEAKE